MTNQEAAKSLREMADFIEAHELGKIDPNTRIWFWNWDTSREGMARIAAIPGGWDKGGTDSAFMLERKFGPFVLTIASHRETVCERVVVGTKHIPATEETVIPARPARTEEMVEWRCTSLLAEKVSA
jgi:hypothetical protein